LEFLSSCLGCIILFVILGMFARGGPHSTDSLYYLDASLNNLKDPFILNRYMHVFIQKLFVEVFSSPLVGAQFFWAFEVAITGGLVYWAARSFSRKSNLIHGILAILIFFSAPALGNYAGTPLVDITVMLFVSATILVYLLSLKTEHKNRWLLIGLGFLLVVGFKVKETTMINLLLLIGLGVKTNILEKSSVSNRFRNVGWGALIGLGLIFLLNGVILGDFLFGFRISDWSHFYNQYLEETLGAPQVPGIDTWLSNFWFASMLAPFLLYIAAGIKEANQWKWDRLILWLMPVVFILVTQYSIGNQFGYEERFALPIMPVVAFLAVQVCDYSYPIESKDRSRFLLILGGLFTLAIGIRFGLRILVPALGGDLGIFIDQIFQPTLLVFILVLFFVNNSFIGTKSLILGILIASLMVSPVIMNFRMFFISQPNYLRLQAMIFPLEVFPQAFDLGQNEQVLVSPDIWNRSDISALIKNPAEIASLANVVFHKNLTRSQFIYSSKETEYLVSLTEEKASKVLISKNDFELLTANQAEKSWIEGFYNINLDENSSLVFLQLK
jgi:hypothetical protein